MTSASLTRSFADLWLLLVQLVSSGECEVDYPQQSQTLEKPIVLEFRRRLKLRRGTVTTDVDTVNLLWQGEEDEEGEGDPYEMAKSAEVYRVDIETVRRTWPELRLQEWRDLAVAIANIVDVWNLDIELVVPPCEINRYTSDEEKGQAIAWLCYGKARMFDSPLLAILSQRRRLKIVGVDPIPDNINPPAMVLLSDDCGNGWSLTELIRGLA